jgi:flavin reductase (DIM6/NTAB) family NADH-FMN oxidoreductase RutF
LVRARRKDSVANAEETGEFVFNMATYALRDAVVLTSAIEEPGIDEMASAGLTPAPSRLVKPPRVAECPISLECKHYQTTILPSDTSGLYNSVVVGRVVGIHIDDSVITATGKLDMVKVRPLRPDGLSRLHVGHRSLRATPARHHRGQRDRHERRTSRRRVRGRRAAGMEGTGRVGVARR